MVSSRPFLIGVAPVFFCHLDSPMRFNWFLPFSPPGRSGPVRRGLKRIASTWLASPLRRLVQTACLLAFLVLFCYVAWPYTARPGRAWHGWVPAEVDGETGRASITADESPLNPIVPGMALYAFDPGSEGGRNFGPFKVIAAEEKQLQIEPVERLDRSDLDALSFSFGPWSLFEDDPDGWPSHYSDNLKAKEIVPAPIVLALDPLLSISAAVASRSWVWSLTFAAAILAVGLLLPRSFCSYVCPLGTLIDLFDWVVSRRLHRVQRPAKGWWIHLKYYLLLAVLSASLFGVLVSGFVAAIPVVTRGLAYLLTPVQTGIVRGWHQVPPMEAGQYLSIGLLAVVFGLGLLRPRFWCKYVCPTGATFSLVNCLRGTQRQVEASCIGCGKCLEICPFDAIRPDFSTRAMDCTFCQTCGGVCPARSIKFVPRWDRKNLKTVDDVSNDAQTPAETSLRRRRFLAAGVGLVAGGIGGGGAAALISAAGPGSNDPQGFVPVRPPGSVPEQEFLRRCIRCGECFQACPNDVLQPLGFQQGLVGLWTPHVAADWSGCEVSCNNCGQVCPTGAIRAISLDEKRAARMALAVVDLATCLPYAGREPCQLCLDECTAAGYDAIEFVRSGTQADELGNPIEGTGFLAPLVLPEKCVGCGLCQTRCRAINVVAKGLIGESAVRIEVGPGKEDRLTDGSYLELREEEQRKRQQEQRQLLDQSGDQESYLPDFLN
jgi:ferredoxin